MNKSNLKNLVIVVCLVSALVFAYQPFLSTASANHISLPKVLGMGDLHLKEFRQGNVLASQLNSAQLRVGMGDLHLYDSGKFKMMTSLIADQMSIGMGDLHLIEYRQSNSK